jgi:hypothetical protein
MLEVGLGAAGVACVPVQLFLEGGHARPDEARADGVATDAERRGLQGEAAHQADDAVLGRGVVAVPVGRLQAVDGRDHDD